jgi:phage terminase small subunit
MVQSVKLAYRKLTHQENIQAQPNEIWIDTARMLRSKVGTMTSTQSRGSGKTLRTGGERGSTSHDLTPRRELFVLEYLKDLNGTKAAERAGYSQRTANEQAARLLANVSIQAEIQRLMDARAKRIEINGDRVLQAIAQQAFYDVRKFFDEKGNCKEIHELDDQTADAVAGFEYVTLYEGSGDQKHAFGQLRKFKLADKRANRELLGKHLGLFKDITVHEFDEGFQRAIINRLDVTNATPEQLEELAALDPESDKPKS